MDLKKEFLNELMNNEKIIRYKQLEEVINNNLELKDKLTQLKAIQQELVHAEEFKREEHVKELNKKYDEIDESINEFPLLSEYLDLQEEINLFLKDFTNIIEENINQNLK